jgi:hypothetical protein
MQMMAQRTTAANEPPAPRAVAKAPSLGNQGRLRQLSTPRIQTKLEIGAVDDPLGHKADRVAEQLMRMPEPSLDVRGSPLRISRTCAACDGAVENTRLWKKSAGPSPDHEGAAPLATALGNQARLRQISLTPPSERERREAEANGLAALIPLEVFSRLPSPVHVTSSQGSPLPGAFLDRLRPAFAHDLSEVRLLTDARSAEAAAAIDAEAFTVGVHIHFGRGAFQPTTPAGAGLLAHELGHVVRQRRSGVALDRRLKSDAEYAGGNDGGDWTEDDQMNWRRDSFDPQTTNTFILAANYNTKNKRPDEYKTIDERSEYYALMQGEAGTQGGAVGQTRFFGAAQIVTDAGHEGVGVIEAPAGWALHSADAIAVLKEVNRLSLEANIKVINNLINVNKASTNPADPASSAPISALQFDLDMVEKEQSIIEDYLVANKAKISDKAIKDINDDLNFKGFWRTLAQHTVVDTLTFDWAKNALDGGQLDFMVKAHRVAIGRALVCHLHGDSQDEYLALMKTGVLPPEHVQASSPSPTP